MKVSEKTKSILSNYAKISPHLILREGNVVKTMTDGLVANARIEETIPSVAPIWDLNRFLKALKLFGDDVELEFDERSIIVKNSKKSMNYRLTIEQMIQPVGDIEEEESDLSFDLSKENLQEIFNSSSALQLPDLVLYTKDNTMYCKITNTEEESSDFVDIVLVEDYDDELNEEMTISLDLVSRIMLTDYTVFVYDNMIKLSHNDDEIIYYITRKLED